MQIPADEPPPPPPVQQPSDDELELDREMEYLVEPDEAEARASPKSSSHEGRVFDRPFLASATCEPLRVVQLVR